MDESYPYKRKRVFPSVNESDRGPEVAVSDRSDPIWTSEVLHSERATLIAIVPRSCEPVNVEKSMGRAEQVVTLATFE